MFSSTPVAPTCRVALTPPAVVSLLTLILLVLIGVGIGADDKRVM
jgi:hypothetical protein